jgi:rubrerythrin
MSSDEEPRVRVTKVSIDRSPEVESIRAELEATKAELEEKKSIIEQSAMSELEKEKQSVLDLLNESDLSYEQKQAIEDKLDNPANLELVKAMLGTKQTKKPPKGKAPFLPPSSSGHESTTQLLDDLYDKAYVSSSKYDKETVEDAKKKIQTLWNSLLEGDSYSQMRDPANLSMVEKRAKLMSCPKCGYTLVNTEVCPNCGEDWSREAVRKRKTMRTWTFKPYDNKGA